MRLFHFSNKNLDTLKPDFQGENSYSKNISADSIKRIFFYNEPEPQECYLEGTKYLYEVNVADSRLYNLIEDKDNLVDRFKGDIFDLLQYIREHYLGCFYDCGFKCFILFNAIEPKRKIIL